MPATEPAMQDFEDSVSATTHDTYPDTLPNTKPVPTRVAPENLNDSDLFCAVSLSGTMRSAVFVILEKSPLAGMQAFSLRTRAVPIFSNIQRLLVNVLRCTRVKSAQFCGMCRKLFVPSDAPKNSSAELTILVARVLVNTCVSKQARLWCMDFSV